MTNNEYDKHNPNHYYIIAETGVKIGNTVKEARKYLKVNGGHLKELFKSGKIKRVDYD